MSKDDEKTESMNDTLNSDEEENEPLLASYESSLTSSPSPSPEQSESESESEPQDPKSTHKPPVSRVKRTSLFVFFAVLCWFAYSNVVHNPKRRNSKVVHASRSVSELLVSLFNPLQKADENKNFFVSKK